MTSKNIVCIQLGGGMDGINFLSPRDSASVTQITSLRQSAPSNILNYTDTVSVIGNLTAGSAVVTSIPSTTGLSVGMLVYGLGLPAVRSLTISSVDSATQITLSESAYVTSASTTLHFGSSSQLLRLNEVNTNGRNPAFHYTQKFLWDAFNTPDTIGNASKTKAAVIPSIGTLRKKLYVLQSPSIYAGQLAVVNTTIPAIYGLEVPALLTSHNDQTSTVQSNAPEGAVKGWGGGIADIFIPEMDAKNSALTSISATGLPVFTAGSSAKTFTISQFGLIGRIPNVNGVFTNESDPTTSATLTQLFLQAFQSVPANDDLSITANQVGALAVAFQPVLNDVMEITDVTSFNGATANYSFNISGSDSVNGSTFAKGMKSIARMILANNPNRGATATRSGNIVTLLTEITTGVANRTSGSNLVTVTSTNHRLFTSNTGTINLSDSVIVLGNPTAIDSAIPVAGYKITVLPSDVDNSFTFTGTDTTTLVNVPVTIRLKHNLKIISQPYIIGTGFDSVAPTGGYTVTSVPDNVTFTVNTTDSGAFTGTTLAVKFKLINLTKQVYYSESTGFSWDTHPSANHSQLAALDAVCKYFNSLVSRIQDADVVTFINSEFGRTISTNSVGTDHAWSSNFFVFGKSVKGNKVYGDIMDYSATGIHRYGTNQMMPTTSLCQYGATFARWMGATDAQVLTLFPDLQYWPSNERYLGFL